MADYKFSVGKIVLTPTGGGSSKTIEIATNIEIDYSVSTTREIAATGVCTYENIDEEKIAITFEFTDNIDTTLMTGGRYNVALTPGVEGGGITVTLNNCLLTGYNIRTAQDAFAIVRVTLSKTDTVNSSAGATPEKQKVKFGSTYLGDSAFLVPTYQGNVVSRIIPTALGTIFQTTTNLGGGQLNLQVRAKVTKTDRLTLESYVVALFTGLNTDKATLTVEIGSSSYTLTNCVLISAAISAENKNFIEMTFEFTKSAF